MSEDCHDEKVMEVCNGKVIMLMEDEEYGESALRMYGENVEGVYKYQSSDKIVKEIMGNIGGVERSSNDINIVGVYSLGDAQDRTYLSLSLAKTYAQQKRTLYINLDEFSGLGEILPDQADMTLSDALYEYRSKKGNVCSSIVSGICSIGGLDYIPPVSCAEDIAYVEVEEMMDFIKQIGEAGSYDVVVLDISSGIKHGWKLLEACSSIYMPQGNDYYTRKKIKDFEVYFISRGMEVMLNNVMKIEIPEDAGGLDGDFWRTDESCAMHILAKRLIS